MYAAGEPGFALVLLVMLGGYMMAGGANAVNMYIDRDIDAIMQRTRSRPIPRGSITPRQALVFGIAQAVASGAWLALTVNLVSAALAIAAFLFYTLVYSAYLKRTTVHNTVLGGAAGAVPPLIGWTAVTGTIGLEGVLLFLIVFYWQPPHFWALALGLTEDYRAANVPMMPVVLGEHETKRQIVLYATLTAAISLVFGVIAGLGALYLAVAVAGGAGFVWFAIHVYRTPGIGGTRAMFRYSTSYLALLFAAMVADRLLIG
jgi:protoheme IX farnesyltransferase